MLGCLAVTVAVLGAVLSVSLYNWFRHQLPPAHLTAATRNLAIVQHLSLQAQGRDSPVSWSLRASYVRRLAVTGPDVGTAEIILPLPRSQCQKLAASLNASCQSDGQVLASSPVTFAWSSPQLINSTGDHAVISTSVDLASSGARPGALSMTVLAATSARPSLCFSSPFQLQAVTLTVTGGAKPYRHRFSGYDTPGFTSISNCADGLPVVVGSNGAGFPPALEFSDIRALTLRAWASSGTLQGFSGEIDLDPGAATVVGAPTIVSLGSPQSSPLSATFQVSPHGRTLTVRSSAATSVITNNGQLVPSYWARNTDFLVPLLGGLISVLVINPLGVSTQALLDAIKAWRPILWWRDRRTRKRRHRNQKKVRHAN